MGGEIRVRPEGVLAAGADLFKDKEAYRAYRLRTLTGVIPGAGSADHDGRLADLVTASLAAFTEVVTNDAARVRGLAEDFSAADEGAAAAFADA